MAANNYAKAFWNAFVTLLLKMIAGLGFAVPAGRTTAAVAPRPEAAPLSLVEALLAETAREVNAPPTGAAAERREPVLPPRVRSARHLVPAARPRPRPDRATRQATAHRAALARRAAVPSPSAGSPGSTASHESSAAHALVPRIAECLRELSLPPTMKQRIRAEAHGASPVARSGSRRVRENASGQPAMAGADESSARTAAEAHARTADRRRDWALCA
ncbi:DUF6344 domain-containing protein [Streptomyces sp. NPDC088354]|uniref:DUF6344 domain-containing protein n=1 Tax=unclassified Streptomyces TaxID=2593676 RepID=UPI0029BF891C|nr:DUF6344 domain-containing protein [Streptomyces sp. MI02-7b]MDX3076420.1 DUF6344 domain-containing protein [Streptomyces sp. MI02-7b]